MSHYFFWLLVRDPTPSVDRGVGSFLDFEAAPSPFLGRPAFVLSPSSFFCFFAALSVLPPGRTVLPSAFSSRPPSLFLFLLSPFFSASSCFLLSPAFLSLSSSLPPPPPPAPPPDPFALDSTFSSDAFLTTLFPDRSTLTAGLFGSAFFLILLPRLDVMETSPSCFFSATVPPGAPPPQFHETTTECCVSELGVLVMHLVINPRGLETRSRCALPDTSHYIQRRHTQHQAFTARHLCCVDEGNSRLCTVEKRVGNHTYLCLLSRVHQKA